MNILISGAGIAGPTLAYFLAKAGAHITVVEKSDVFRDSGQNIDVHNAALTVVEKMGLLDRIRQLNTTEKGTQFLDPEGRPFALFPVEQGKMSFTREFEILRGDLAALLYEATRELSSVQYMFGTTIEECISNDKDAVEVRLSTGQIRRFDLAVAADGQWSQLRKMCFSPGSITVVDKNLYVAHCTIPRLPSDTNWWTIYTALGSRMMATRPDPYGTTKAMVSTMPCNKAQRLAWQEAPRQARAKQEDLVRTEFAGAGWQAGRFLEAMHDAPDFYLQAIQQIRLSRWSCSRIVCLGDAAYAPTPLTGMGTPLAIIGAYVLAGEISKLKESEHPSEAFHAYENVLRPLVEKSQKIPFFIPAIAHPKPAWKRWLLQCFISAFSTIVAIPWLASYFVDPEQSNEDFSLPIYTVLDGKSPA